MQVLTKRASEEIVLVQAARVLVLETAADEVKLAILDLANDFAASVRETTPDAKRPTGRLVQVIAPYGEVIETDAES
jgi:hypothetical protein